MLTEENVESGPVPANIHCQRKASLVLQLLQRGLVQFHIVARARRKFHMSRAGSIYPQVLLPRRAQRSSVFAIPMLDEKVWGHPSERQHALTPLASKFVKLRSRNDAQLVKEFFGLGPG